jgi:hypothetical protein
MTRQLRQPASSGDGLGQKHCLAPTEFRKKRRGSSSRRVNCCHKASVREEPIGATLLMNNVKVRSLSAGIIHFISSGAMVACDRYASKNSDEALHDVIFFFLKIDPLNAKASG